MHYSTRQRDHGLPHDPFKALITPRPIGWVSTISAAGIPNLAPFSFFNAIGDNPPMLMFSVANRNDTLRNIEETGECTCSIATKALTDAMNMSSATVMHEVDEFVLAEVETAASVYVKPPRVAASPAALECKHWQSIALPERHNGNGHYTLVLVEVVGVYLNEDYIRDGRVDTAAMQPLARLGYMDYAVVNADNMFSLNRPTVSEDGLSATLQSGPWNGQYQ